MRRLGALCILLLLVGTAAHAAEFAPTPTQYLVLKIKTAIVVDGKLGEWDMANAQAVINPEDTRNPLVQAFVAPTDPIKNAQDISGRVAVAWDDQYLYFAGAISDDHLLGVRPDSLPNQGPAPWGCDSVMVDMNSFRQPMKRNNPYSNNVTLGLRYAPMGPNPRGGLIPNAQALDTIDMHYKITEHSQWAVTETPTGWNVEVAMPWADLEYTPRPGERIFMALMLPDVDPDQSLKQLGWGMGGSMKSYPVFRLVERRDAIGSLTFSADEVAVNAPWAIRVEVDARTGPAKLEKLQIVDGAGEAVLERTVAMETPQGQTGTEVVDFKAGEIAKLGTYAVEAVLATAGGPVVLVRQPLRMVEPVVAPPLVSNPSGEIHHMRPSRVAHNAVDLHNRKLIRHDFVKGRDDYLPFIMKYAEPGFITTVRGQIDTKGPWGYGFLLQCLALYKATGDDAYVKLGRDLMDYELTRAVENTVDSFRLYSYAALRYYTWLQDANSPWAPPDAEKRYRAMFYPIAEKPDKDLFAESGTHNRIWHRYCLLKVARQIAEEDGKPIDQRVIDYTDFHAKLLEATGDDDDASSGYNWGWFYYALAIYYHQGSLQPVLDNPGFVKTITRYAETISPSGAMPTFGADSGWPSLGQSIWTFELMASLTKDGRFRWNAHRVAEYVYNYLGADPTQYHLPADNIKNNFLMGYFFADEGVAPVPAPANSRLTWRHPLVPTTPEDQRAHPGMAMAMDATQWIPDKLILSSGNNPRSPWGLVELLPIGGHGGSLPGNLIALLQQDSVLMAGQGYYEQTPNFQNILWAEDQDGLAANPQPVTVTVPRLADDAAFTAVRVHTTAYQELPLTYTRDIVFGKGGFVVVKDRAKFDSAMKVRLGPCFQTRDIGPQCGDNWFNTYYEEMYLTGLGLGRGVQSFMTPPWDLLVYFSPRAGRQHSVVDTYAENPYRQSPIRMRQSWAGMTKPGQEITFTSVLLPHAPTLSPQDLLQPPPESEEAPRIEVVQDDDNVTVLKVVSDTDGRFGYPYWVMINNTGAVVKAGPLESDAWVVVVRMNPDGTTVADPSMTGGTVLRVNGVDLSATARKVAVAEPTPPAAILK